MPSGYRHPIQSTPFKGSLSFPGYAFAGDENTGIYSSAADEIVLVQGGVAVATFSSAGLTMNTSGDAIIPAALSGTMAQHGLYQGNVVKGWAVLTISGGTPTLANNFNVSGITDQGQGDFTITWDRDFGDANYAVAGMQKRAAGNNVHVELQDTPLVGSCRINCIAAGDASLQDPDYVTVMAIGGQ